MIANSAAKHERERHVAGQAVQTFAIVICVQHEGYVFQNDNDGERPEDEGHGSQDVIG